MAAMVTFGTSEWSEVVKNKYNANKEARELLKDWDLMMVLKASGNEIESYWLKVDKGEITDYGQPATPEIEKEAEYVITAEYDTWKKLINKEMELLYAVLGGHIDIVGDLGPIVDDIEGFKMVFDTMQEIPTIFP